MLLEDGVKTEKIHFLHIGKTGGTALGHVLREYSQTENYEIASHFHDISLEDIPVGEGVFFCLRDPLSRFVSSFYSRQRKGQPRYNFEWSDEEKIAFSAFETVDSLGIALASKHGEHYDAAVHALTNIYHVRSSYYDWFKNNEYFLSRASDIRFVGFQESLNEDFARLKAFLSLPKEAHLPTNDIEAHRNPAYVDRRLSPEAAEALRDWYKKEYSFYNFCKTLIAEGRISAV